MPARWAAASPAWPLGTRRRSAAASAAADNQAPSVTPLTMNSMAMKTSSWSEPCVMDRDHVEVRQLGRALALAQQPRAGPDGRVAAGDAHAQQRAPPADRLEIVRLVDHTHAAGVTLVCAAHQPSRAPAARPSAPSSVLRRSRGAPARRRAPRPAHPPRQTATTSRATAAGPREPGAQRLALDVLHRDEQLVAHGADVVDRDHVGVGDPRQRLGLAREALARAIRCSSPDSPARPAGATRRSGSGSWASYTTPIPRSPIPSGSRTARCVPGSRSVPGTPARRRTSCLDSLSTARLVQRRLGYIGSMLSRLATGGAIDFRCAEILPDPTLVPGSAPAPRPACAASQASAAAARCATIRGRGAFDRGAAVERLFPDVQRPLQPWRGPVRRLPMALSTLASVFSTLAGAGSSASSWVVYSASTSSSLPLASS